jgi:hypothetical protein
VATRKYEGRNGGKREEEMREGKRRKERGGKKGKEREEKEGG